MLSWTIILIFYDLWILTEYVRKYATEDALREQEKETSERLNQSSSANNNNLSSDSESSMSDFSEDEARDMEL